MRDHARLADRLSRAVDHHSVGIRADLLKESDELAAVLVVADNTAHRHFRAEAREVSRDVTRSPEPAVFRRDVDDHDRRLGRDAADLAPDVVIEKNVADYDDRRSLEASDYLLELRSRRRLLTFLSARC